MIATDRITATYDINKNKKELLNNYLNDIIIFKNMTSKIFSNNYIQELFENENLLKKYSTIRKNISSINNFSSAWCMQKFFNDDLIEKQKSRLEQLVNKSSKIIIHNIKEIHKYNKITNIKEIHKTNIKEIHKYNKITNIKDIKQKNKEKVKIIEYIDKETKLTKLIDNLILAEYNIYRLNENNIKQKDKYYSNLQLLLNELYSYSISIQNKVLNLVEFKINNIKDKMKNKPIIYKTPSLILEPQSVFSVINERIKKDEINNYTIKKTRKYKYFYRLDIRNFDNNEIKSINIPLAYNEKYHKDFLQYSSNTKSIKLNNKGEIKQSKRKLKLLDINNCSLKQSKTKEGNDKRKDKINKLESLYKKEHYINISEKSKRLTISLTKEKDYEENFNWQKNLPQKVEGVDIGGSKDNLLCSKHKEYSYDKFDTIIEQLNKFDTIKSTNRTDKETELFKKIFRQNISYITETVANYLKDRKKDNVTDIVLEKLDRFVAKDFKYNKKEDEKYNRIWQLLRSESMVNIFRKIGNNLGIKIHTIPSYYTSQWCNKCGCVHKDNRKGKKFKCLNCGYENHSDKNAAENLEIIFERFSNSFCVFNNNFKYFDSKKYIKKDFVKNTLTNNISY